MAQEAIALFYASFLRQNGEIAKQEKQVEEMRKWCSEAEITGTPTFFIN